MHRDSRRLIQISTDNDFTEIMSSWITSSDGNCLCGWICPVYSSREPVYCYPGNLTHRVTLVDNLNGFLIPCYQRVILFLSVNAVVDSVGPVQGLLGLVIPYSEPRLVDGWLAAQQEVVRFIWGGYPGGGSMIARSLVQRRDVCTHASHGVEDPARKKVETSFN